MSDLAELFARDPRDLTRDDIREIVAAFRERRHLFNKGNLKAGSTKPKTEKQKVAAELGKKLNLGDLDL